MPGPLTKDDIYVCLPAYNEATVLPEVIASLKEHGFRKICVIDDGSTDGTSKVARSLGITTIAHQINRGAGAAVQTGIEVARLKRWPALVFMDADGQHLPEDIHALLGKMTETNSDLIVGSRFLSDLEQMPASRRLFNAIGNLMTNIFCKQRYTDSQSGLRLLNQRAINELQLEIDGFGFCSEMLIKAEKAGLKISETPTHVRYTDYSRSKGQDLQMGFSTAFNFLFNVLFK
ncbi:dolichol-phosphate mannose synthase [Lewinellaceae bacterium SD302]|nr:dolichol-phosphate mannose synthase [Lewinellaceae bacterium SD302]